MSDYYKLSIKCPHCKKENDIIYQDDGFDCIELCEHCKKKFKIVMEFKVIKELKR